MVDSLDNAVTTFHAIANFREANGKNVGPGPKVWDENSLAQNSCNPSIPAYAVPLSFSSHPCRFIFSNKSLKPQGEIIQQPSSQYIKKHRNYHIEKKVA
jgi:hypothetical protein